MMKEKEYCVLGLMSGTSLDGLDLALCTFQFVSKNWTFKVLKTKTIEYNQTQVEELKAMESSSGENLWKAHIHYGKYLGKEAEIFLSSCDKSVDLIASHGHTIFHQPDQGYTFQAGDGQQIAKMTCIPVVANFREKDISLGGQGAPLVPKGDLELFHQYDVCLNIGGFANMTDLTQSHPLAFDICPANYVLNRCVSGLDMPYDEGGKIAQSGKVNQHLLGLLNELNYYAEAAPKSLGREWVEHNFMPLIDSQELSIPDQLATLNEHIALQISASLEGKSTCLVTGGGAHNSNLMQKIQSKTSCKIVVPEVQIIDFKEAIIFAFLGVLHRLNIPNCLSSATGADSDSVGGIIYQP